MKDQDRQEWSRHYDKLQWAVITITSAGIGTLVAASFNTANKYQLWPEISGLALSILGAAYVASFRAFRSRLHQGIYDEELRCFLSHPGNVMGNVKWFAKLFAQWNLFMGSFLAVDIVFLCRLTQKGTHPCISCILSVAMTLILCLIWWKGVKREKANYATDSTQPKTD